MQGIWHTEFDAKVFSVEVDIADSPLLVDTSWKNDIVPSFSTLDLFHAPPQGGLDNDGLVVWCDAARRVNRGDDSQSRYAITRPEGGGTRDPNGENAFVLSTDSLDEVMTSVEAHTFELWRGMFVNATDVEIDEVAPAGHPRLSWDTIREDLIVGYREARKLFVVMTCHEGTDMCVCNARPVDCADPGSETFATLAEAMSWGRECLKGYGDNAQLWDFSENSKDSDWVATRRAD